MYMKAGLNLPGASTVQITIYSTSTLDASPVTPAVAWVQEVANPFAVSTLSTTAYTRVSVELQAPFTNTQSVMIEIALSDGSATAGVDNLLYVTGVKIDQFDTQTNANPTPFIVNPYALDMLRCQRYYQVIGGGASNTWAWAGSVTNTKVIDNTVVLPVPMLKVPTPTVTGTWAVTSFVGNPSVVTGNNTSVIIRNTGNATAWGAMLADTTDDSIQLLAECSG
jgi:hypothetical protein